MRRRSEGNRYVLIAVLRELNASALRYTGSHADEVADINFLEGNSNLGDAIRLATP